MHGIISEMQDSDSDGIMPFQIGGYKILQEINELDIQQMGLYCFDNANGCLGQIRDQSSNADST